MEIILADIFTDSDQSPYQPIDSENGEVRLVELWPGEYDDTISLSLRTTKLDAFITDDEELYEQDSDEEPAGGWSPYKQELEWQLEYEALSYAWGTAFSPRKALLDGLDLGITENLEQGLRRLRLNYQPRMLWIDALSINQRDTRERSHQVQQMATIYNTAKGVLIWLGEWPKFADCPHPDDCQMQWINALQKKEKEGLAEVSYHVSKLFVDVLALPWFSRLWVIQELALAKTDPFVLIGTSSVTWSELLDTVTYIIRTRSLPVPEEFVEQFSRDADRLLALGYIRSHSVRYQSLFACLVRSQYAKASDPRDKVYGLLGLCDFQVTEPMVVDYSKCLHYVFAEATLISLLEESALPYINPNAMMLGIFDRDGYGSSWIINFLGMTDCVEHGVSFRKYISTEERERRRISAHLSEDRLTLYVYGRYIGTVYETRSLDGENGEDPKNEVYDFYHNVLGPRGITPRTLLQALDRKPVKDEEIDDFANLLLGSRDTFHLPRIPHGDIFITEEGHVGSSWHASFGGHVNVGAILVYLFGTEVPFILVAAPETQSHELTNVAYIPGCGDSILNDMCMHMEHDPWIDFAAEGCKEYAIL